MSIIKRIIQKFRKDERGAALVEYTVLLGILLVAVIAIIAAVGVWINGEWAGLNSALATVPTK
jgi:pilus assembly protein Flp/PilA